MNDAIKTLAKKLASSYSHNLVNKTKIIEFVEILRNTLLPNGITSSDYIFLCEQLHLASEILKDQIIVALSSDENFSTCDMSAIEENSDNIVQKFLAKLPQIKKVLKTDLQATYDGDPAAKSIDEILVAYPGIYAISLYRIAHELYLLQVPFLPRIITEYAHSVTGIDIHPGAQIGKHFFIDHGTGVVIGETTMIGHHVKIYHGVTLGARSTKKGQALKGIKRHPTIGNKVTIYSNATIVGGDTIIGNNVTIGANAFVDSCVADETKVIAHHEH